MRVRVDLDARPSVIDVGQALGSPRVILHMYDLRDPFLTVAQARALARALDAAADWQDAHGPIVQDDAGTWRDRQGKEQ